MSKLERLQTIFKKLSSEQQQTLLEFAEFLLTRIVKKPLVKAELIPRQSDESVIAAIKRLSKSYPMLDKAIMLDKTSILMTEHIMQGRDKTKVIDELETIFLKNYERYIKD
ncbi:MAG: Crp/Fnr family transcriptional regulator [Candidatus Marithrix sp.]